MDETLTLTYIGRRLGTAGKVRYGWLHGERELLYGKLRAGAIGGQYTVDAEVTDDDISVFPGTLRYTEDKIDDAERIASWQALDQAAQATATRKAAERRHSKSTELDEALAPLVAVVQRARTRAEADAILRIVDRHLNAAWWNR